MPAGITLVAHVIDMYALGIAGACEISEKLTQVDKASNTN